MKLSFDEYLKARGLHLLASEANKEVERYEAALSKMLGLEPMSGSHICDSVYGDRGFDEALKLEGIEVEDTPNPPME